MKKLLLFLWLCLPAVIVSAQKINGQWRGFFNSNGDIVLSGGDNTEYVLELDITGTTVSGYSYTYFQNRQYYVICSLSGNYNKKDKTIRVTETARIKGLTPQGWSDCLQTHLLKYEKSPSERLVGSWKTASSVSGDCGFGNTTLTRRTLSKNLASYNKSQNRTPYSKPKTITKAPDVANLAKKYPPVAKTTTPTKTAPVKAPPVVKNDPVEKENTQENPVITKKENPIPDEPDLNFEKRNNTLIQTITIKNESFKIDLYDNGDVDGDSISLFYNGKLLLSHKRLSERPISLTLDATTDKETNELIMYAENLGEIPPNTALMVVTDGPNRYEVRIASDLQKSGTIRFVHEKKTQ